MKNFEPCLWFDREALEAAEYYVGIFPNSSIKNITYYDESNPHGKSGEVLTVEYILNSDKFLNVNGGPIFKFNESISFMIPCKDQKEMDYFYEKLSSVPESEQCGWIKDKYGLSWQIVPEDLQEYVANPDKEKAKKAMQAVLSMKRLNIDEIKKAFNS